MGLIYKTKNFIVEAVQKPHVTRDDGGHIKIYPQKKITDRTKLSPQLAIEFMRLTMIVGEALKLGMEKRGIKIIRVNYQDMGNWAYKTKENPYFHLHVYGRAKLAKYQPYIEAIYLPDRSSGFYEKFKPLNGKDIEVIKNQIESLIKKDRYDNLKWGL
jgi:diadenosine tetraphosphate (Ap4A) HIT family hydrolase